MRYPTWPTLWRRPVRPIRFLTPSRTSRPAASLPRLLPPALRLPALLLPALLLLAGCDCRDEDCSGPGFRPDHQAPAAPQGIRTITGDHEVEILWLPNTETDLDGYGIYRNDAPTGYFERLATVGKDATRFVDRSARNGMTYYYALDAFDRAGNESDLSYEDVFDTPRPAGYDLGLTNAARDPRRSGYDFSAREVLDYRDLDADVYFWFTEQDGFWMVATERSEDSYTDIQDVGYRDLDDVDWAPVDGWSPSGDVPLIPGHCYVVWTWDNHFAKFRVIELHPDEVILDWAYQIDRGNPELSRGSGVEQRTRTGTGARTHRVGPDRRSS